MAEINYFRLSDLDELYALIGYTVKASYRDLYSAEAIHYFLEYLNKDAIIAESKDNHILVLKEGGHIVGTATLINRHVKRLFVSPDCQVVPWSLTASRFLEKLLPLRAKSSND